MLDKKLILKIYEGFSIQRWNDLIRPFEIVEMDKAAEKMIAAYIIGKYEESSGNQIDWTWMIYASIFDLLKKIALCDIKSPVQRLIKNRYPEEYVKLNEWVLNQYRDMIDQDLVERFLEYLGLNGGENEKSESTVRASRVMRAAHKFSSLRELDMMSPVNEEQRLTKIRKDVNEDMQEYLDLKGLQLLLTHQLPFDFLMMVERLRFQIRWNQTPRVPKTSVLGHSFFVAVMTFLLIRESGVKMCAKRIFNDFFSALFHDLPEAVTRDIISPVKQATENLPSIVKQLEDEIVQSELVPLMDKSYADEVIYFSSNEFENRIRVNGLDGEKMTEVVSWEDLNESYNSDEFSPVDGKTVRIADHLSALIEADSSIKYGITSRHLINGRDSTLKLYLSKPPVNGINVVELFFSVTEN